MTVGLISVDGGELSYEVRGEGDPVVLLHGGALTSRMWDDQVAVLERRHTVVRYDARGHGRSSTPTGPFAHYEDLRQLLDGIGVARASLVGLSQGARISTDFALVYPEMVDRLLLAAPGVSGMTFRDPFVLGQIDALTEAITAGDAARAVEAVLRMWVDGPRRAPDEIDQGVRKLCREMIIETGTRHGPFDSALVTEAGAVERLGELRAPILALVGDLDSTDIHLVVDLLADKAHARKQIVRGAAHMVNLERPEEFDRAMLEFLETP